MSTTITTAWQLAWQLASSENQTVTDQGGVGRTVTVGSGWFRIFLAPNTGVAGTSSTSPTGFTVFVQAALNTGAGGTVYTVSIDANGFITIRYTGTGTAVITWHANHVVRNLLGFTGTTLSIPTGTTQTATYHPTHTMYASFRDGDTNKLVRPQRRASRDMPDGSNYGFKDNRQRIVQRFNSRAHPLDWTTRTTENASITPFLPDDKTRWKTTDATAGIAPPWSVIDTFAAGDGNKLGGAFGTFQKILTGAVTTFDEFYFSAEFLKRQEWSKPTVALWDAFIDVENIEINWFANTSL